MRVSLSDAGKWVRRKRAAAPAVRAACGAGCLLAIAAAALGRDAAGNGGWATLQRFGARDLQAHDPSRINRCDGRFYIYATGVAVPGIISASSTDLVHWRLGPPIFRQHRPAWFRRVVPRNHGGIWAPDCIRMHGLYYMYYAVSTMGSEHSAIGLATSPTLNPRSRRYHWTDRGVVIASHRGDGFNAIDPCPVWGRGRRLWMSFGSYWTGIKLVRLNPRTGLLLHRHEKIFSLAANRSIEASYIYRRRGWYYLFVNFGQCCEGVRSTYNVRVGRSRHITGPYIDAAGKPMLHHGGSPFLQRTGPFIGPGQVAVERLRGRLMLSCHFYDGLHHGIAQLAIMPLRFRNGWPVAGKWRVRQGQKFFNAAMPVVRQR